MKVMFHTNTINYRGTTVAVTDYARYNQEILGNESVIAYCKTNGSQKDMGNEQAVIDELEKEFQVVGYRAGDLPSKIDTHKIDTAYFIDSGQKKELPTNCKTDVHAVFQCYEPHGDRYAYISKWLSETVSKGQCPYVPHMVDLPPPQGSYKKALGISDDKIVIGRLGGYQTFDIIWVKEYISSLVRDNDKFVFIFVGTEPFVNHPNVKFINEIYDRQKKANFINTCDAMIHARQRGESFGLSVAEFLSLNKPVLAWNGGTDKNHIDMLAKTGTLYNDRADLNYMLHNLSEFKTVDFQSIVSDYTPSKVMNKFNEVFLT